MTLRTGRGYELRVTPLFFGQKHQGDIVRMLEVDHAVAGVTIKSEAGEGLGRRIYRSAMTTRASIGEFFLIPSRILSIDPLLNLPAGPQFALRVKYPKLSVAFFF